MRTKLIVIISIVFLLFGGTAIASDQNQLPEIYASLSGSEDVVTLNNQHMQQIEGTFFLPMGHPSLRDSIRGFLADPVGTIEAHLPSGHPSLRDSIRGFLANPFRTLRLHFRR